jgi:hypothetical protein
MNADDIEHLLQEIPVHSPAVVPVRTVQEAVAAGDLPPLDVDAAYIFSLSEHILQDHVCNHNINSTELRDLIIWNPLKYYTWYIQRILKFSFLELFVF